MWFSSLENPFGNLLEFSSIYEDYLRKNTDNSFWLVNTNKLVRFYEGIDGLKTGYTEEAGFCISATAKKDGLKLWSVSFYRSYEL